MGNVIDLMPLIEKRRALANPLPDEFYFYLNEEEEMWVAEVNGIPTYFSDSYEGLMEAAGWDCSEFDENSDFDYEEM